MKITPFLIIFLKTGETNNAIARSYSDRRSAKIFRIDKPACTGSMKFDNLAFS